MSVFDVHESGPDVPTVLLSSGLGGTASYWSPQIGALKEKFRIVTYDQAGTGRNASALPSDYSIAAMADDVLAVLEASGTAACHFVGHALGALVGLELARRHRGRLLSLSLVNGWAKVSDHTRRCFEMRLALLKYEGPTAYVRAQPIFLYPADWLEQHAGRVAEEEAHGLRGFQGSNNLRRRISALLAFDATTDLAGLDLPTLVVAARDDVLVPSAMSSQLADAIRGAELHVLPWGGHAVNVTAADAFNAVLRAFLDAQAS